MSEGHYLCVRLCVRLSVAIMSQLHSLCVQMCAHLCVQTFAVTIASHIDTNSDEWYVCGEYTHVFVWLCIQQSIVLYNLFVNNIHCLLLHATVSHCLFYIYIIYLGLVYHLCSAWMNTHNICLFEMYVLLLLCTALLNSRVQVCPTWLIVAAANSIQHFYTLLCPVKFLLNSYSCLHYCVL